VLRSQRTRQDRKETIWQPQNFAYFAQSFEFLAVKKIMS